MIVVLLYRYVVWGEIYLGYFDVSILRGIGDDKI